MMVNYVAVKFHFADLSQLAATRLSALLLIYNVGEVDEKWYLVAV